MYMVKEGSAYHCDVAKAGTSEARPVERVAAIQNHERRCETFPPLGQRPPSASKPPKVATATKCDKLLLTNFSL